MRGGEGFGSATGGDPWPRDFWFAFDVSRHRVFARCMASGVSILLNALFAEKAPHRVRGGEGSGSATGGDPWPRDLLDRTRDFRF